MPRVDARQGTSARDTTPLLGGQTRKQGSGVAKVALQRRTAAGSCKPTVQAHVKAPRKDGWVFCLGFRSIFFLYSLSLVLTLYSTKHRVRHGKRDT
jgi:hypothetical protein